MDALSSTFSRILQEIEPDFEPYRAVLVRSKDPAVEAEKNSRDRQVWYFLTLGIPRLIAAFSHFAAGIIRRKKEGTPIEVTFDVEKLKPQDASLLSEFQNYNKYSHRPLKRTELKKVWQIVNRLINKIEQAKIDQDAEKLAEAQKALQPYQLILSKISDPKYSRANFSASEWNVLDTVTFELACDHFERMVKLYNADWMAGSHLQSTMHSKFGFNYHEAAMAESLSLGLAYIEGLDGKTISLPVLNATTGKYESQPHVIKESTLGDALPCYILEPVDDRLSPWLIVRGTQSYTNLSADGKECRRGSLESMLADSLDPDCISRNVVNKSLVKRPVVFDGKHYIEKESLSDLFRGWHEQGRQVNLAGHSLGGTIVNALTIEYPGQIRKAYGFSAAGMSNKMAKRWEALLTTKPEMEDKLLNFDYEGDLVPAGGKVLIGTHLALESLTLSDSSGFRDMHVRSRLNNNFHIWKVDVAEENQKFVRRLCEAIRIAVGTCFWVALRFFQKEYLPDWWLNRKIYRKHAKIERAIRQF